MTTKAEAIKALDALREYIEGDSDPLRFLKLTLCVNPIGMLSGKPDAAEIRYPALKNHSSEWFYRDAEGVHFIAVGHDEKPAVTDNAKYGRTELLDERRFGPGDVYDSGVKKYKIKSIGSNGKVVFMQIHRGNKAGKSLAPAVKFVASNGGLIRALVKKTETSGDSVLTFAHRFKLDEWFSSREIYKGGKLLLTVNEETKEIDCDLTGADATYGKWGNYNNSSAGRAHVVMQEI